jgi:hypothetical protein
MKEKINKLMDRLLNISQEQYRLLEERKVEEYLELGEKREVIISSLLKITENYKKEIRDDPDMTEILRKILRLDQTNIDTLSKLMHQIKSDLTKITKGQKAFYAYVGKDSVKADPYFVDKER